MKIVDDDGQVIAEGQVLSLEPGDVLVLQMKRELGGAENVAMGKRLEQLLPSIKAVVLGPDDELSILRRQEVSA